MNASLSMNAPLTCGEVTEAVIGLQARIAYLKERISRGFAHHEEKERPEYERFFRESLTESESAYRKFTTTV